VNVEKKLKHRSHRGTYKQNLTKAKNVIKRFTSAAWLS